MTHQWDNPAGTKRVAGWLWTQHLGVPVLPDYSTDGTECQCRKGSECTRPGKHPVWAGELLGPFYEDGVTPTDPWRYASREYADVREWVRLGYSLAALVVGFVAVDVEGGGKDGQASLAEWARLYGVDLADVTDTLTVRTGGGGRHYWLALPERWRWAPPVELQPCDGWLPGVDIKLATAENPNSKATLPGSAHRSGRPYTLQLPPNGNIPAPREAPERLLRAVAQGRRWEPLGQAERDALRPLTANEHLTGHLRAWRHARRFLGPAEAAPPRRSFRGVRLGSLTPAHDLRGLTS